MLDLGHLPFSSNSTVSVFDNSAGTWVAWQKPRGHTMGLFIAIGAGGGGGNGFTRAASAAGGGGGGGGGGGTAKALVPLIFLPDTIYINVGNGGAAVAAGGATHFSIVSGSTIASNELFMANGGNGGTSGTGAAVGAGGTGGGSTLGLFHSMGLSSGGATGATGGAGGAIAGGVGSSTAIALTGSMTGSGAGGAGTTSADFAGGGITAIAGSYISEARPVTPAAGSVNGASGHVLWKPYYAFQGCGGSSSNTGVGGNGGSGAYGCGGAGGGAGTTGGAGGRGGNGIAFIITW